jgi:ankyrin repeat protein
MLNPEFAQVDWRPDPSVLYRCSPCTNATGFTYVMALVMSGRDTTGQLARQAELEAFLTTPDASNACKQTNSQGWTVLMLAARNSNTDSTEDTVARLLAHESSGIVARMQTGIGWTALMMAARYSNTESSEATAAMLLAHESAKDVASIRSDNGATALGCAIRNSGKDSSEAVATILLAHESSYQVLRMRNCPGESLLMEAAHHATTPSTKRAVAMLVPHVDAQDFQAASLQYPAAFHTYLLRLHESAQERAILSTALRQGLSLVEATTLLYL